MQNARQRADAISVQQLKLFESIGRLNSVRKASEECNLSQPAVTQALAKLEQHIGVVLVERRASGSYLNGAGTILLGRAQRFFTQLEAAIEALGEAAAGQALGLDQARLIARRLSRSQIRSLVAIVEQVSFEKAAKALDLSTASLQRAARDLEGNLRRSLFYRTAAGIMVTPAGANFGRRVKLALQEIELGLREIDEVQGSFSSEIVIGAMPFGGSLLLAAALDDFISAYPKADVRIVSENAMPMFQRLRRGDVDFVVGLIPQDGAEELRGEALAHTPYRVVGRQHHPILRKGKATLEDVLGYDWVIGTEGSNRRACFDRLFPEQQRPGASIQTCALPIVRHLLAGSDRLTLMTSYELFSEGVHLAEVPFAPIDSIPAIGLTVRADWLPTRLHTALMDSIRRHTSTPLEKSPLKQAG